MSLRKCQIEGCGHDAGLNGLCLEHACVVYAKAHRMRAREKQGGVQMTRGHKAKEAR